MSNVIRQTRHQVETLTWLRAILLICAEGRKALAEVSEALRDGESIRTSCATYVAESCLGSSIMKTLVNRFVQAGHFEEVATAGAYCAFRVTALAYGVRGVGFTPTGRETDELFLAIEQCADPSDLEELADCIEAEFAGDYVDELEMAKALTRQLVDEGNVDRLSEAAQFCRLKAEGEVTGMGWEADDDHPINYVLKTINKIDDVEELTELANYIEAA